ncbi:hypothetical protein CSUI_009480 [Cystoisospora suis]|uniref:Peptidase A2 domain-containing protein n=1 Tax=Cystoisospora suis TaxID=483139 RepID=A0A2C6KJY4_9APIC|nr:hypothetical protein CSUI_009480 [Cystoisospora suis]
METRARRAERNRVATARSPLERSPFPVTTRRGARQSEGVQAALPKEGTARLSARHALRQAEGRRSGLLLCTTAVFNDQADETMMVLPLIPPQVESTQVMAFLDTGATRSLVSPQIAGTLRKEVSLLGEKMTFKWIRGEFSCDAREVVKGVKIRIASYITTYDLYVVDMGFDVILGLDFLRHAKPWWDFMTDEVHFRCPTDESVPPGSGNSSNTCISTNHHIPPPHVEQLPTEATPEVTRDVYTERAKPPQVSPADLEQMVWPSRKSNRKKTSPLEKKKFIYVHNRDRDDIEGMQETPCKQGREGSPEGDTQVSAVEHSSEVAKRNQLDEVPFVQASPEEEAVAQREERKEHRKKVPCREITRAKPFNPTRSKEIDNPLFNTQKFVLAPVVGLVQECTNQSDSGSVTTPISFGVKLGHDEVALSNQKARGTSAELPPSGQLEIVGNPLTEEFRQVVNQLPEVSKELPGECVVDRVIEHHIPTIPGAIPEYHKNSYSMSDEQNR